jgi:hypothetical protein
MRYSRDIVKIGLGLVAVLGVSIVWAIPVLISGFLFNWSPSSLFLGIMFPLFAALAGGLAHTIGHEVMGSKWYQERQKEF